MPSSEQALRRSQDLRFLALGEDHRAGGALRAADHLAHHLPLEAEPGFEPDTVLVQVDLDAGDAALHRGLGDRGSLPKENPGVER